MKKLIIILIVLIGFLFVAGIFNWFNMGSEKIEEPINTIDSDESKDIIIKVGDKFTIALESNPTTGFSWMDGIEQDNISFIEKSFVSSQDENIVGAGGIEYFTYQANEIGESEIYFTYCRPWESVQPLEQKTFHIIVQ